MCIRDRNVALNKNISKYNKMTANFYGFFEYGDHGQIGSLLHIHIIVEEKVAKVVDYFKNDFTVAFAISCIL